MSDARSQLLKLMKMQELALEIQAAHAVVDGAPARIEEAEGRFRERNAEYVGIKERYDAIDADRRSRSGELATLEETRKHYQDSLMQVKNQREYAAVLKEIDAAKASIGDHEDAILASMDEIESLKTELESRAAHIETERTIVENERAEVEAAVAEATARIERARCGARRDRKHAPRASGRQRQARRGGPQGALSREGRAGELLRVPRALAPAGLSGDPAGLEDPRLRQLPPLPVRRGRVRARPRLDVRPASGDRHEGRGGQWRSGLGRASTAARAGIPGPAAWGVVVLDADGRAGRRVRRRDRAGHQQRRRVHGSPRGAGLRRCRARPSTSSCSPTPSSS